MSAVRILVGDVRARLAELPDESAHCVVTSPPYWGLRDYGLPPSVWGGDAACAHEWAEERVEAEIRTGLGLAALGERYRGGGHKQGQIPRFEAVRGQCVRCGAWRGQLGLEPTVELYLAHIVEVFREVRRVLRRDGTLWLNMGDCYAAQKNGRPAAEVQGDDRTFRDKPFSTVTKHRGGSPQLELKPKDLVGLPWLVAFALRADGWWLRRDVVWAKPNPMPESTEDRPTTAHEYLFLLTKRDRYFYDAEAVKEPTTGGAHPRGHGVNPKAAGKNSRAFVDRVPDKRKQNPSFSRTVTEVVESRNLRSVWTIATKPFKGAHFATFPPALVEPCIKAGTSERGCCPTCGAPWRRVVEKVDTGRRQKRGDGWATHAGGHGSFHRDGREKGGAGQPVLAHRTVGWRPTCRHEQPPIPCTVLDPFGGAGTVGLVARNLRRAAVLIELSPEYAEMARRRIGLFAEIVPPPQLLEAAE